MSEKNVEMIKMLIRFYNVQASCSISATAQMNQNAVETCLNRVGGDAIVIKNHIRKWVAEHKDDDCGALSSRFEECMEAIEIPGSAASASVSEGQVGSSLNIIEKAVAEIIVKTQAESIKEDIMGNVEEAVRAFIKSEYGAIERKVTTVVDGVPKQLDGVQHEKFGTVLKFVANNKPVYLTGPAGSGKNVLCKQIADALGLKFYFTNAVTQEYKLTGFTDAMGNYQETQFYKAFTQGGLFMLDEMDASIPEVLVILNAAIANKYFDFPAPIGYVEAHPDFRVIAAGNTLGHGASHEYTGRQQIDAASLNRFAVVKIDYSADIENSVAGDIELADFCREFRRASEKVGISVVISYRNIDMIATMSQLLPLDETLDTCLIKGMEKDDIHMIENEMQINNKYMKALRSIARQ